MRLVQRRIPTEEVGGLAGFYACPAADIGLGRKYKHRPFLPMPR